MRATVVSERKTERIDVRASATQKALLQRAAEIETRGDLSEFMLSCAELHAGDVLRAREESELSTDVRDRFYELLLNPPAPREKLIALFAQAPSSSFRVV